MWWVRIRSVISFHPSKLWKAKFSIQDGYIFWWGCKEIWNWSPTDFAVVLQWDGVQWGVGTIVLRGRRARGGRVAGWIWQLVGTRNKQEPPTTPTSHPVTPHPHPPCVPMRQWTGRVLPTAHIAQRTLESQLEHFDNVSSLHMRPQELGLTGKSHIIVPILERIGCLNHVSIHSWTLLCRT